MSLTSTSDVAGRLGRSLATSEETAVAFLITAADAVIATEVEVAIGDLDAEVTPILRIVATEIVCRALANPQGISSLQEQLGQYGNTVRFRDLPAGGGLWLTDRESLLVRGAVYGTTSGSGSGRSVIDRLRDLQQNRDVDDPAGL